MEKKKIGWWSAMDVWPLTRVTPKFEFAANGFFFFKITI
jgi:hypothetical protein